MHTVAKYKSAVRVRHHVDRNLGHGWRAGRLCQSSVQYLTLSEPRYMTTLTPPHTPDSSQSSRSSGRQARDSHAGTIFIPPRSVDRPIVRTPRGAGLEHDLASSQTSPVENVRRMRTKLDLKKWRMRETPTSIEQRVSIKPLLVQGKPILFLSCRRVLSKLYTLPFRDRSPQHMENACGGM